MQQITNVSEQFEAGLWVPARYGDRFCVSSKVHLFETKRGQWKSGGRIYGATSFLSQFHTDKIFDSLEECQAECDRRNGVK